MTSGELHAALRVVRTLEATRRRIPTARMAIERNVLLAASQILVTEIDTLEDSREASPAQRLAEGPPTLTVLPGGRRTDGELDDGPMGAA